MSYFIHESCQLPHDMLQKLYLDTFGYKSDGSFVEVGAYDGITYSNTCGLAFAGWTGLYIEADPKSAIACTENHKNNKNIIVCSSAIGNETGKRKLYKSKVNGDSVSSILLEKPNIDWGCREDNCEEVDIDTLNNVLAKYKWKSSYDLLVIDVEEAELEVLAGYSIDKYSPQIVIIEINNRDDEFSKHKKDEINKYFCKEYAMIYSDHINTIFIRNKH